MVAIVLPAEPLPHYPRRWGQMFKIQLFRTWSCFISNLLESGNVQHGRKYFAHRPTHPPPPTPAPRSQKVKVHFLEHGHVAYQIYWNQDV